MGIEIKNRVAVSWARMECDNLVESAIIDHSFKMFGCIGEGKKRFLPILLGLVIGSLQAEPTKNKLTG